MINFVLFKREIKANYKLILIFMVILAIYSSMIVSMFDPEMGKMFDAFSKGMPELAAAFGMAETATNLTEFLANYLYGFILVIFPLIFVAILANRLVTRYINSGSMAYLLATPNKRFTIIFTQAKVMGAAIFSIIVFVIALCIGISEAMFPGQLDIARFFLLNGGLIGLLLFLGSICFCSSCIFSDTNLATGVGTGINLIFFLLQTISQVGEKFENLKYVTPMTLFDASGIIKGNGSAIISFVILYIASFIIFGVGMAVFTKKDLSL